jgi:hypothetical protein
MRQTYRLFALVCFVGSSAFLAAGEGKEKCVGKCCDEKGKTALASLTPTTLSPERAEALAKQIRAESCPDKSSEILASALPGLTCKDTLAKLTSEIKAKGCEKEASELILAAQAKLTPKPEAQKKN